MRNNAISVANAFIKIANETGDTSLTPLKLMKLVYIAHGFGLALLKGDTLIDPRFDKVEAWKLGPVIPSVYHTFKHYENSTIKETAKNFISESNDGLADFCEPTLEGKDPNAIVSIVWKRYGKQPASKLVEVLHQPGTPWAITYRVGENREIPDELTKLYYSKIVDYLLKNGRN